MTSERIKVRPRTGGFGGSLSGLVPGKVGGGAGVSRNQQGDFLTFAVLQDHRLR